MRWLTLARILGAPWRIGTRSLPAFFAYSRGDEPLADIALKAALRGDGTHALQRKTETVARVYEGPSVLPTYHPLQATDTPKLYTPGYRHIYRFSSNPSPFAIPVVGVHGGHAS